MYQILVDAFEAFPIQAILVSDQIVPMQPPTINYDQPTALENALEIISKLGPIATLIAAGIAYRALQINTSAIELNRKAIEQNRVWNRQHYATNMIANWNKHTKPIIDNIEIIKPKMIDFEHDGKLKKLSTKEATAIYNSSTDTTTPEWKLRTYFIHLLNEFEVIATAYERNVGDREMLKKSFSDIFVKWGYVLSKFVGVYKRQRDNEEPWGSFHELYNEWSKEILVQKS